MSEQTQGDRQAQTESREREGMYCISNITYRDGRWERPYYTLDRNRASRYLCWLRDGGWRGLYVEQYRDGEWHDLAASGEVDALLGGEPVSGEGTREPTPDFDREGGMVPITAYRPERPEAFRCTDVRVNVEVECWPVGDPDAKVAVSIRECDEGHAIAAWLSSEDACGLAEALLLASGGKQTQ